MLYLLPEKYLFINLREYNMQKNLFLLIIFIAQAACAMEEKTASAKPIIYFTSHDVVYLGNCKERAVAQEVFNEKFPLNTLFFYIKFVNSPKTKFEKLTHLLDLEFSFKEIFPEFIPYDYIKDKKEGDAITLKLQGKLHSFICQQLGARSYRQSKFEDMIALGIKDFKQTPNFIIGGEEVLFEEKIVKKNEFRLTEHGENCSPFLKK